MDLLKHVPVLVIALVACVMFSGCIGVSPEQAAADALGPDLGRYENGPLHRAGFPCTRCHGDAWWQESPTFELAGTVYRARTDRDGIENAQVVIKDAAGHEITARTNRAGNFFLERDSMPFELSYPLHVSVVAGGLFQSMRSPIWREQSCATCHSGDPGEASNGPIFTLETNP